MTTATSQVSYDEPFARALARARAEFQDNPDLQLTVEQASRRWACNPDVCVAVLVTLGRMTARLPSGSATCARSE